MNTNYNFQIPNKSLQGFPWQLDDEIFIHCHSLTNFALEKINQSCAHDSQRDRWCDMPIKIPLLNVAQDENWDELFQFKSVSFKIKSEPLRQCRELSPGDRITDLCVRVLLQGDFLNKISNLSKSLNAEPFDISKPLYLHFASRKCRHQEKGQTCFNET